MAIVTPSTDLLLLKCPIEVDQQNQITFSSYAAQEAYFRSLPNIEVTDFTYQRKDGIVRFPAVFEEIRNYNYVMYKNSAYGNKWFYCFITEMRYANDGVTEIKLKTDVFQTWQLSLSYKRSFVEREHVSDDTIGAHTLNEEINTGEYMINSVTNKTICAPEVNGGWIALAVTEYPTRNSDSQPILPQNTARVYNGIVQGCYLMLFEYNSSGTACLSDVIKWYDNHGKKDAIAALYALPKTIYPAGSTTPHSQADPFEGTFYTLVSRVGATDMGTTTITRNSTLNGYTPKNNKMFCYPYNYLLVTNNNGTNSVYHYEDFTNTSSIQFKYNGVVTEGSDVKAYPVNYKKNTTNLSGYNFGIDMGKTPTFSWLNDMYLNWKAQNSFSGQINQAGNFANSFTNMPAEGSQAQPQDFFGWLGGVVEQGVNYFGATIGAIKNAITGSGYKASIVPDQVNGETVGDLNFAIGRCGFTFYQMSVRAEVAAVIDNYFSIFGYRVNSMKTINITSRRYWNYIKCIQANIEGNIPQDDMNEIKGMFNTGCTFWHDPSKYLDYSQNNTIV